MEPTSPTYDGAWIGAIIPALLGGDRAVLPEPARTATGVVVLALDGLGWRLLQDCADAAPVLCAMEGGPVPSVVPSTTAAGLTSIATGAPPSQHGLVGYRIRVAGEVLNVLVWPGARHPDPVTTQPIPPFQGRAVPVVTRSEFRSTGFTTAHLRGTTLIGWKTTSALVTHIGNLVDSGRPLVYAYYDGVDRVAHEFGLRNEFLRAEVTDTDRLVGDLLDRLPGDWALVVTADHGQVHVEADGAIGLDDVDPLVAAYSGEGRFRSLFAVPGGAAGLLEACADRYGDRAWVFSRERLCDEGWLGPSPSLTVRGRVGDVVLAARDPVIFVDPELPFEKRMRSHHGSITSDEVMVPLLAARGNR